MPDKPNFHPPASHLPASTPQQKPAACLPKLASKAPSGKFQNKGQVTSSQAKGLLSRLLPLFCLSLFTACAPVQADLRPPREDLEVQAAQQLVQELKSPPPPAAQTLPPSALVELYADELAAQGPDKEVPDYIDGSNWFPSPGLLSITECEHCRLQTVSIISSDYGLRKDPRRRGMRFHDGIDIRAPQGSDALAFRGGEVIRANNFSSYGKTVEIQQYDGYVARYAHLSKINVQKGQIVEPGEKIGEVGRTGRTTGSHLHFELLKDGQSHDPQQFLTRVEEVMRCLMTGKAVK